MKKTQINCLAALLSLALPIWGGAQTMALEAISASGGLSISGGNSLTWTLGEALVMSADQGDVYLGSGFQQAKKPNLTVGLFTAFVPSFDLKAYPNPVNDWLSVETSATELHLRVYDLLGRQMLPDYQLNGIGQLDFSPFPAGTYLMQAYDEKGRLSATVNIQHFKSN